MQCEFEPNIHTLYKSIHTICRENFIKAADVVQQIQVYTLQFIFSSEHAVARWIFTNHESNFLQLFFNSSNDSVMKVSCPLSI